MRRMPVGTTESLLAKRRGVFGGKLMVPAFFLFAAALLLLGVKWLSNWNQHHHQ